MMKRFIGLVGANATGKSTRMNILVDTLKSSSYEEINYQVEKKGKKLNILAGRVYDIGNFGKTFIIGRKKRDGGWVGGDHTLGKLGSIEYVETFFGFLEEIGIENVICESYFANSSTMLHPVRLFKFFNKVNIYWMFYDKDKIQQYIDRCNFRSGKDKEERGIEWAIDSAGWRQNLQFGRTFQRTQVQADGHKGSSVRRILHDVSERWLVNELSNLIIEGIQNE